MDARNLELDPADIGETCTWRRDGQATAGGPAWSYCGGLYPGQPQEICPNCNKPVEIVK